MEFPACPKGARLDILVEAMGRINFGRAIKDFKLSLIHISLQGTQMKFTLSVYNSLTQFFRLVYHPRRVFLSHTVQSNQGPLSGPLFRTTDQPPLSGGRFMHPDRFSVRTGFYFSGI